MKPSCRGEEFVRRPCRVLLFGFLFLISFSSFSAAQIRNHWLVQAHASTHDLRRLSFIDGLTGWACGDSGTIVMTSDGGETWLEQNSTVDFDLLDINVIQGGYGWALAQQYPVDTNQTYGTDLLRTTNGGEEWFFQERFNEFYNAIGFVDSLNGCMAGNLGKILWTEDGGVTWTSAVIDSPDYARWPIYRIEFRDSLNGLAMGGLYDITGLVWMTTDGGRFWTHRRVAGEPIFASHYFDPLNILCVGGDLDYGSGMVRSFDGGQTWEYTYLGIWGQGTALGFRTPSEGWAPLGFAGTYMWTADSGQTWSSSFTPDSTAMFDVVFIDSTLGYMVGARGTVLKYVGPTVSAGSGGEPLPDGAELWQNYPNPFNPSTLIRYRVAERSTVTLTVVDMAGRIVRQIEQGIQDPGLYSLSFQSGNLASGVYLARVLFDPTAGERRVSRAIKMLLLR